MEDYVHHRRLAHAEGGDPLFNVLPTVLDKER